MPLAAARERRALAAGGDQRALVALAMNIPPRQAQGRAPTSGERVFASTINLMAAELPPHTVWLVCWGPFPLAGKAPLLPARQTEPEHAIDSVRNDSHFIFHVGKPCLLPFAQGSGRSGDF